jgi:hypothetical protein
MKITIARLRSGTNFTGAPLLDIMDSFYVLFHRYMSENPQHKYGVYNFGWNQRNKRKLDDIKDSDVVIVPSENEFQWHIKGYRHSNEVAKSHAAVKEVGKYLSDKHLIIFRSDRADNENLYRTKTFRNQRIKKISILDEMDIRGGIHGLKYHFIRQIYKPKRKTWDFIYWGCDKRKNADNQDSGDERHQVLKQIKKEGLVSSYLIGNFSTKDIRDEKIQPMRELIPTLSKGRATICFNWLDPNATTSRYHEAIACGIFPFVWKGYDKKNTLIADQWQRISSVEEFYEKMPQVDRKFSEIENHYLTKTLKHPEWYYKEFRKKLDELLKKSFVT